MQKLKTWLGYLYHSSLGDSQKNPYVQESNFALSDHNKLQIPTQKKKKKDKIFSVKLI